MAPKLTQAQAFARLQLVATTDIATIRSTYRELILQHHPDKTGSSDSAARFIEIREAYEYLCKHRIVLPSITLRVTLCYELKADRISQRQSAIEVLDHTRELKREQNRNIKVRTEAATHAVDIPRTIRTSTPPMLVVIILGTGRVQGQQTLHLEAIIDILREMAFITQTMPARIHSIHVNNSSSSRQVATIPPTRILARSH